VKSTPEEPVSSDVEMSSAGLMAGQAGPKRDVTSLRASVPLRAAY
jgi:hypothetical protein